MDKNKFLNSMTYQLAQSASEKVDNMELKEKLLSISLESAKEDLDNKFSVWELRGLRELWELRGLRELWELWELWGLWGLWGLRGLREQEITDMAISAYQYAGEDIQDLNVENLDSLQIIAIEDKKWKFDMQAGWKVKSECGTSYCRAGGAVMIAGKSHLVEFLGWPLLAAMIYKTTYGYIPDFYADNETALEDMQRNANL